MLKNTFVPKMVKVTQASNFYSSPIMMIKQGEWDAGICKCLGEVRNEYKILSENLTHHLA